MLFTAASKHAAVHRDCCVFAFSVQVFFFFFFFVFLMKRLPAMTASYERESERHGRRRTPEEESEQNKEKAFGVKQHTAFTRITYYDVNYVSERVRNSN